MDRKLNHEWHVAINHFSQPKMCKSDWPEFMYLAKNASYELERLTELFRRERDGQLVQVHHQCSHDTEGTPVYDNHLTCCLGIECRKCEHLLALASMPDTVRAWTCIAHILVESGKRPNTFDASEGFVNTVDDKMYWERVYASLSGEDRE